MLIFREGDDSGATSDVMSSKFEERIKQCWHTIESQCVGQAGDDNSATNNDDIPDYQSKIVRVFVSSTFSDYHSEREALFRKVGIGFLLYKLKSVFKTCVHAHCY